jgi:hypothetical protein
MTPLTFTLEPIHLEQFLPTSFARLAIIDVRDCDFFTCADRPRSLQTHAPRLHVPVPGRIRPTA